MNKTLLKKILKKYNITSYKFLKQEQGYRNKSFIFESNGKLFNLILYKNERGILERIKRTNYISNYLADQGFPTRQTEGKIIRISNTPRPSGTPLKGRILLGTRYCCLYNYLPGETIPWEGYSMKHIKALGKTMSDMHNSFKLLAVSSTLFPLVLEEMAEINLRMRNYFFDKDVKNALNIKLDLAVNPKAFEYFEKLIQKLKADSQEPKAILHMDFVRSNILFSLKPTANSLYISGILDFEKASLGPRIVDIARTLSFLIVDCKYKDEKKVRKYFLLSGYKKRGKAELPSLKFLEHLLNFFWMYDFYKFLNHNPYESLEANEHFIRTREILIKSGIIKLTMNN